jgi:hypothetical protein
MFLPVEQSIDEGGDLIGGYPQVRQPPSRHGAQLADCLASAPPAFQ